MQLLLEDQNIARDARGGPNETACFSETAGSAAMHAYCNLPGTGRQGGCQHGNSGA